MVRVLILIAALLLALLVAQDSPAQTQCPELPFYALVPFNYPCPIHPRVCRTDYGYCRLPTGVRPGTPCACQASNGVWYQGIGTR